MLDPTARQLILNIVAQNDTSSFAGETRVHTFLLGKGRALFAKTKDQLYAIVVLGEGGQSVFDGIIRFLDDFARKNH